jgi:alkaline phosphatase D
MSPDDPAWTAPQRTLLGPDQEAWFAEVMQRSVARWRLIGQHVMVGPMPLFFNADAWSGYPAARQRFLDVLQAQKDSVVLTGDVHTSWAVNLTSDPHDTTVSAACLGPTHWPRAVGVR